MIRFLPKSIVQKYECTDKKYKVLKCTLLHIYIMIIKKSIKISAMPF